MRILKIILIAIFLFSAISLSGFCDDSHCSNAAHHQCAMTCQSSCCQLILPDKIIYSIPLLASFLVPSEDLLQQEVIIFAPFRPPIALS